MALKVILVVLSIAAALTVMFLILRPLSGLTVGDTGR